MQKSLLIEDFREHSLRWELQEIYSPILMALTNIYVFFQLTYFYFSWAESFANSSLNAARDSPSIGV